MLLTMTDVWSVASINQLKAAVAAVGPLNGGLIGLYTNVITPTRLTTLAQLTEPTYAGYVRQVATWSAAGRDQLNQIGSFSQRMVFQETGGPTVVSIQGAFLVDTTGLILYGAGNFVPAIPLADLVDYFALVVEVLGNNNNQANVTLVE